MDVQETLKGQNSSTLEFTTIGGKIGDFILHVAGMPVFAAGEDAVVFVERTGPFSTVVGLGQGKFTIANGEVSNNVSNLEFADGAPSSPTRMPISRFKQQIKNSLGR
jgi:hypothetical protein